MTGDPSTPSAGADRFPLAAACASLLGLRAVLGAVLVFVLLPVCLDDHFRVFHAAWWWEHPSFTSSYEWLPGFLYIYGPLVGLTGDTVFAPRAVTLVLHLTAGALLAGVAGEARGVRWLAAAWLLCSPLSLVLGTVPLTESLSLLAMLGGLVALSRFSSSGDPVWLLPGASAALYSSMLRYELWVFLPLFTLFALARRPARMPVTARILAFLPWCFPLVWTALLWAVTGEPFSYLTVVRDDHLGPGSLAEALASPPAWILAAQAAAGALAAIACLSLALRRGKPWSGLLFEAHALAAILLVAILVVRADVPSQYPERMLLWVVAFCAIPVARLADGPGGGVRRRLLTYALAGGLLLAASLVYALGLPPGIPRGDLEAGLALRESFARGHLGDDDHVVIERLLPESTAPFVYANRPRNVHIDALGNLCPPRLLSPVPSICPVPEWAPRAKLALVLDPQLVAALEAIGWSPRDRIGDWTFVLRGPGARPLPLVDPDVPSIPAAQ